ncbi:histidine phosphatase family protein [Listeria sp. ILCC792]|uniref:histidine phosphatase family protein n=1 Tax=Listeria sp. ILCC792 TaxID=1918331 RepID=UPI000B58E5DF|nr:histidine phosphatase family protein [Listeria sp. ILCC792]
MKKHIWKLLFVSLSLLLLAGCGTKDETSKKESAEKADGPVTLYVTRHGKTMFNTAHRVQGWSDTPLTEPGVEVAEQLGSGVSDIDFKAAYSSDSGRARETARIVLDTKGQKKLNVQESPKLREVCYGSYEGDLNENMWTDIAKNLGYPSQETMMQDFAAGKVNLDQSLAEVVKLDKTGSAESYDVVKKRMQQELKTIAEENAKNGGGNVLVVSHGMAIGAMISDMTENYKEKELENASVTKITYDKGKFTVDSIGDMSYVEAGKKK